MSTVFIILLWGVVLAVSAPAVLFAIETLAAFLPLPRQTASATPSSVAVVVPAHNEGSHIVTTLHDLRAQLRQQDRLIVIADNCTDDTAAIARECGAEVFVRVAPDHRGKGYALQYAIDCLRDAPPQCVAFFDADCRVGEGALHYLAGVATATGRPAQALNIMNAPDGAGPETRVSAFAWIMINRVRMIGLSNLINVTRFTGVGLAAPWALISRLDFAVGDITEDLMMTLKMAAAGTPPVLAPDAQVTSFFPTAKDAGVTQRARWEHGSLEVMARRAAPAMLRGILRSDIGLMLLAADAMIPPLVVLGAALSVSAMLSAFALGFAGVGPFATILTAITLFALALVAGWLRFGRVVLPPSQLGALAPFLLQKLKVYGRRGRASSKTWTRTKRGGDDGAAN